MPIASGDEARLTQSFSSATMSPAGNRSARSASLSRPHGAGRHRNLSQMLALLSRFCRPGLCCAGMVLVAASMPSMGWAQAGSIDAKAAAAADTPQALKHGELVFHGNY